MKNSFADPESAEAALTNPESLHVRRAHMALTDRAFERTPAARLGNRPVTEREQVAYQNWREQRTDTSPIVRRSLMLGIR